MKVNLKTILHYGLFLVATCLALVATIPAAAQSDVIIEKATNGFDADAPPGPTLTVGDPVTWTYEITASGARDLVNIVVTDDQGVTVTCPASTLGAGLSMVCTANGTVVAGQYANIGTVDAELPDGTPVNDSDPSHYFGVEEIVLTIETATESFDADDPPGPVLPVGDPVNWTYEVTNTGTETLTDVTVTDDQGVTVTCPASTLATGESMTCTASGTVVLGQYMNLGIVTANLPDTTTVAASDPSHHFGQVILIEKATNGENANTPPGPVLEPGDPVNWTYEVTNPGPETITDLMVDDDQEGAIACPVTTLAADESTICTASGVAQVGQYTNIGTATALLPLGGQVTAASSSHYFGQGFGLQKYTNGFDADAPPGPVLAIGETVNWTYVVANATSEDVTDIVVTDSEGVTVTCPGTALLAGESMTCTASDTVSAGQYMNLGTATGEVAGVGAVTAEDSSHYFGQHIELVKSTNGENAEAPPGPLIALGDPVEWTYEVTNPGPDAVINVTVTDDQGETVTCPSSSLSANSSMVCTAYGTAVDGQYSNIGTVSALLPLGGQVTASDVSHYLGVEPIIFFDRFEDPQ